MTRQSAHQRWDSLARAATEPVPLDGEPEAGSLGSYAADIVRRCQLARRRHGGHPSLAWSTSERLAVALVLRDWGHVREMGYTIRNAEERVTGGMAHPPQDFAAWLDQIRAELNTRFPAAAAAERAGQ